MKITKLEAIREVSVQILLSTYNGSQYLSDFLSSLCNQTYKNFSVLIRDDCSTDDTTKIIKSFAKKLNIKLLEGQENIGWQRSYFQLVNLCNGDLIFFADQDDVWCLRKIETIVDVWVNQYPNVAFLYVHEAFIINEKGERQGSARFLGEKILNKGSFFGSSGGFYGCCMAVHGEKLKSLARKREFFKCGHDFPITVYAILSNSFVLVSEPLTYWRLHQNNSSIGGSYLHSISILFHLGKIAFLVHSYLFDVIPSPLAMNFYSAKYAFRGVVNAVIKKLYR